MKKHYFLILLVCLNLIVGLFVLPSFGESVDELSQHMYAERTIQAVDSLICTGTWSDYFIEEEPKQGSHGPAFITMVLLLRNFILPEGSIVQKLQFSHFLYFVVFQIGIGSFYFLARRWMSDASAFGATLLFNTQPLLIGHAFMNPKDVVFMSLLITSAMLGLWMVDRSDKVTIPAHGNSIGSIIRKFFKRSLSFDVWLAGFVLGFASAIRLIAPLIGIVILVYILVSKKWYVWPRFMAYGLIAFGFMVILWPYLWPDPFERLIASVSYSVTYPGTHLTLFRGVLYDANEIPPSYLPVLLAIQLTEPVLLLMIVGAISFYKKFRCDLVGLTLVWFVLPVATMILMRVNLYNNYRQVFFLLPPLFLIAGFGLNWIFSRLQRRSIRFVIMCVLLLPGLYAIIALHPYQYIYYNQLVGGVSGAFREFELDYWNLAFMEAQTYINRVADQDANVFVSDSKPTAQTFARPDLVFNAFGLRMKNIDKYDYIIVSTAKNVDMKFANYPTVFMVERDGVPLAYVKMVYIGEDQE
ncbi:MAG: hypothetical protein IPP66_12955 [Anaerolineales bacterium]|nr:hypothetical protein [Anaerolineales bacterium]